MLRAHAGPGSERMTPGRSSVYRAVGVTASRALLKAARPPGGPEVARVLDLQIPALVPVASRIYDPDPGQRLPVLLWVHGGGWCLGDLDSSDRIARELAVRTGSLTVVVDYRLAPEAPYPNGINDVEAAITWLISHADDIGGDCTDITAAGESAGANLVIGVCLRIAPEAQPTRQVLVVPVVDLDPRRASMTADPDPRMPVEDLHWFADQYLQESGDPCDARFNPLVASNLASLPSTIMVTAGGDPLHDGGVELAAALDQAGVAIEHIDYPDARHGFFSSDEADGRSLLTLLSQRLVALRS